MPAVEVRAGFVAAARGCALEGGCEDAPAGPGDAAIAALPEPDIALRLARASARPRFIWDWFVCAMSILVIACELLTIVRRVVIPGVPDQERPS